MTKKKIIAGAGIIASLIAAPVLSASPSFAAVSVETTTTTAAPTGFQATSTSPRTIDVKWAPTGAPNYRIAFSKKADMSDPVHVRSVKTTYSFRNLDPGTTYYFKIRAISADGSVALSPYSTAVTIPTKVAPVLPVITNPLEVASFNIKCMNCYNTSGTNGDELKWPERKSTIVEQVKTAAPDVIGFQEASQGMIKDGSESDRLSQFEDLQKAFVAAGTNYRIANDKRHNCEDHMDWREECVYKDQGASQGTKIFYNADTLDLVEEGSLKLSELSEAENDRYAAWAILRQKSTGKTFFFVDTHIEPRGDTLEYINLKGKQAQEIVDLVKTKNTEKLPVFIVGDMNSTKWTQPANRPYDAFVAAGYVDPLGNDAGSLYPSGLATAEKRINAEYSSFNGFVRQLTKKIEPGANASHLDYIFTTPMRTGTWEMVLNKDANDQLIGIIPSDHNMITQVVELPAVVTPISTKAAQINGLLGAATGLEVKTPTGAYQNYEKGAILWSATTGARTSQGPIRAEYAKRGFENGLLGYPKTDQSAPKADGSNYQTFQNGAIDYSPSTGAWATYGPVRTAWAKLDYQRGVMGQVTGALITGSDGSFYQKFKKGYLVGSKTAAVYPSLYGSIRTAWGSQGYQSGKLGFPTSGVIKNSDGTSYQNYQGGVIKAPVSGAAVITYS